jgi:undecaprenyl-diphosphatase
MLMGASWQARQAWRAALRGRAEHATIDALSTSIPSGTPGIDRWALELALRHRTPLLNDVFEVITTFGSFVVLVPVVIVVGLACLRRAGDRLALAFLLLAYAGMAVLVPIIKSWVGRARPPTALAVHTYGFYAFPSGHAAQAAAVWGAVAVVIARALHSRRAAVAVWTAAVTVTLLVGVSRVYLGAHWLTDVLAGWTLGAAWVVFVSWVSSRLSTSVQRRPRTVRPDIE